MSSRVEVSPAGGHVPGAVIVAVVVALAVGALVGSLVTRASEERPAAVATRVGASHWDAQKLEAMEGRQLAETFGGQPATWDAQKLEAMEGRMLAEEFRAEDPVVRPKRPPAYVRDGFGGVSPSGFRTGGPI